MKFLAAIFGLLGTGGTVMAAIAHSSAASMQGVGVIALAVVMSQLSVLRTEQSNLVTRVTRIEGQLEKKSKTRAARA